MEKNEYRIEEFGVAYLSTADIQDQLTTLGRAGWKVIYTTIRDSSGSGRVFVFVLERKLND